MFPLPITTWLKLGGALLVAIFMWYSGYSFEASRFARYKAEQATQTQKIEKAQQSAADAIRKEKNAQIRNINNQLADAISQLHKRPSRADQASNGQTTSYCTGSQLYAEDAELAFREAARADTIREALKACYLQYDSIK